MCGSSEHSFGEETYTMFNLQVVQWSADDRLSQFEDKVYDLGFIPNGVGF